MKFPQAPPPFGELWQRVLTWQAHLSTQSQLQDLLRDLEYTADKLGHYMELIPSQASAQEMEALNQAHRAVNDLIPRVATALNSMQGIRERGMW